MTYKLLADGRTIQRIEDAAFIPRDAGNRDFRDYVAWVGAGNVPPQDPPLAVAPQQQLDASNAAASQIVETVIAALVGKGVLTAADVPLASQSILAQRQSLRSQIANTKGQSNGQQS